MTYPSPLTEREVAARLIAIDRAVARLRAGFEALGFEADALDALGGPIADLILDVLGVPPEQRGVYCRDTVVDVYLAVIEGQVNEVAFLDWTLAGADLDALPAGAEEEA